MNAFAQIEAGLLHQLPWDSTMGEGERTQWLQRNGVQLRYESSDEIAAHAVSTFTPLDEWDRPPADSWDTSWA